MKSSLPVPTLAISVLLFIPMSSWAGGKSNSTGVETTSENLLEGSAEELEVDSLAVTPEMRAFLDARVPRNQSRRLRLMGLREAIFDPDNGLGVTYGSSATNTAAATFSERSGNCLSFTFLFVALASYLDLEAYFVEVGEVMGWRQEGDFGLNHWHMFAEVELDNGVERVDFLSWSDRRYRSTRRIDEDRIVAHYHSNIGAQKLTAGESRQALAHFRRSLELDPSFTPAKVNMAVAYRRMGKPEQAEASLLEVLADEPGNTVAATNLAGLLLREGREEAAKKWLDQRQTFLNRNPFHHFRLGLRSLQAAEPLEALKHFKRAITRQPDEPIFFEELAVAYSRLGEVRKIRSNLRRALRLTDDPGRRQLLESRLRRHSSDAEDLS